MKVVVDILGDGFGPWNVLGSHVALEHSRALGISGLAYVLHQFGPDQRVQDGIAEAFAGILELSNVKQILAPATLSTGRTSLLEFSEGASAEPRFAAGKARDLKNVQKGLRYSKHR